MKKIFGINKKLNYFWIGFILFTSAMFGFRPTDSFVLGWICAAVVLFGGSRMIIYNHAKKKKEETNERKMERV